MAEDHDEEAPPPAPPQDQQHHQKKHKPQKQHTRHHLQPSHPLRRAILATISTLLLLAAAIVLVLWLIYRPQKPQFSVVAAASYALNTTVATNPQYSQPPTVTAALQFTIIARNPNRRATAHLDRLSIHAAYRDEPLTAPAALPPLALPHRAAVAMSPVLGAGEPVQVSPAAASGLAADSGVYGVVGMRVVLQGRLRWKAGPVNTAHYGFYVTCDLVLGLRRGVLGQLPLLRSPPCSVDI